MLLHKIDEYKHSKIKPRFQMFGKDDCELYAPHTYKGICRLCFQTADTHKRWFEYSLKCIIIQNCWRKYKLRILLKKLHELYLSKIFCTDISLHITDIFKNSGKLANNIQILHNLI
jgi:hypothetical protein